MYETIYYDVVEYGDVLRLKEEKEDCIFQEHVGLHVFFTLFKMTRRLSMQ